VGKLVGSFNSMLDQIQEQSNLSAQSLEREREASRLKDHFLAAVSHELRTPLNAILGWLQIIQTTAPGKNTVKRALESLERNARTQARVVEDLIDISRVVTGKLQLRAEPMDPAGAPSRRRLTWSIRPS
jgi:signal transduction histidine kinase